MNPPGFLQKLTVVLIALAAGLRASTAGAAETSAGFSVIDLSAHALPPDQPVAWQLAALPDGELESGGVPFRIGTPVAVTGIESARIGDFFPDQIGGIKIGRAAKRIHLLHTTLFAEKEGTPLAKLVFRYANGGEASVRLGYGVHARSWVTPRLEKRADLFDGHSRLAWSEPDGQRDSSLRLFHSAIDNPKPGEVIASIDLVSLFSHAAPFVVGLTVESAESKLPPSKTFAPRKPVRDLLEKPDTAYRRELTVRAKDESGAALPGATATLSITDDKESFYFGSVTLDSQGVGRLPYPPLHAVSVNLWVHAPGRQPVVISESKTNAAKFSGEYTATLRRGTTIGGLVKDASGRGIAGAQVVIHRAVRLSPHHYSRMDYDKALTRADGKWSSDALPADLSGLSFEVSHPEFRPAQYVTEGYAAPPATSSSSTTSGRLVEIQSSKPLGLQRGFVTTRVPAMPLLTTNALLAGGAEMMLQPAILVTGTALDAQGKPLTNAVIIFQQTERQRLVTDTNGRFRTRASSAGRGTLHLVVPGQSPKSQLVNVTEGMAPVELKLSPPHVLRGRVVDRRQRPVAGARVRADNWQGTTDLVKFSALTDEDGNFTWTGAPTDQVTLQATKTNYGSTRISFSGVNSLVTLQINRQAGIYGKVFDAETKKPIDNFFVVPGRKYSSNEPRVRWDRSDGARGFGGEYSLRLSTYYFEPEARVMVEAPGYDPQMSPAFRGVDSYVHDFALTRGKGIAGVVRTPDGSPAAGAALVLIQKGDGAYMDESGQLRASGGGTDLVRSDAQGRFEFTPKLDPHRIFVTHEEGFAETGVSALASNTTIKLQKWGQLKGVARVGEKGGAESTVRLVSNYEMVADADGNGSSFSFSLKADPDRDGNFHFTRVPPGEHRLALEYRFKDDRYGESPWSHGFFVDVKSGATAETTLGGTGRRVTGRVDLKGGTHADVDWKRDVHKLMLALPPPPGQALNNRGFGPQVVEGFSILDGANFGGPAMDAAAWRARQRAERTYVLLFDTNGVFHADNVPPGKYQLLLNVTDPEDENYNRRTIGSTAREVTVPDEKDAKVNAPFDIGAVELGIKPRVRVGRVVPSFEGRTQDGKTLKLADFRGKPVLLYFWGLSMGYSTYDFQVLKELEQNYGASGQLVVLGCNIDPPENNPAQFAQRQGFTWRQIYLGRAEETPVPGMFGINNNMGGVLIDAEGRLASGPMRGSNIRSAVTGALTDQ